MTPDALINNNVPDDVRPMLKPGQRWHPEIILNLERNNLILHGYTLTDIQNEQGEPAVKRTGTYWAYHQTSDTLARLAIQKIVHGPLPEMTKEAADFLVAFIEENRKKVEDIIANDGAVLSIEQIIRVCRGTMNAHPTIEKNAPSRTG